MAQTLYGFQVFRAPNKETDVLYDAIGKNSEVITLGDPLTISSGIVSVAGTTDVIYGVADKTVTMSGTNQTVAKVVPPVIPPDDYQFLCGTNSDLTGNATDCGTYYKLISAATGVMQVDVTSGVQTTTSRVVEIVQVDPFNLGGTGAGSGLRQAVIRFVKTPNTGVPTSS